MLVIPAYVFAGLVLAVFLLALVIVLGFRVVEAMSDYGPSYSIASTQDCLEERGRVVQYRPPGRNDIFASLEVKPYRRGGIPDGTFLRFAPTASEAKDAEVPDSDRIRRRGNVLFPELLAGAEPSDPVIDQCLDASR